MLLSLSNAADLATNKAFLEATGHLSPAFKQIIRATRAQFV